MDHVPFVTIPKLAQRLGVSATAVRYWLIAGWIPRPQRLDRSHAVVFSRDQVDRVCAWYQLRAAAGLTRGVGADERQRRAAAELADRQQ